MVDWKGGLDATVIAFAWMGLVDVGVETVCVTVAPVVVLSGVGEVPVTDWAAFERDDEADPVLEMRAYGQPSPAAE